jgi:hypothetical protein
MHCGLTKSERRSSKRILVGRGGGTGAGVVAAAGAAAKLSKAGMSPEVQSRPYTDVSELFYRGEECAHKTGFDQSLQCRVGERAA